MSAAAPFARFIRDYPALIETLRERSDEMALSRAELDRIAGVPDGYSGKILSKAPVKTIGLNTLGPVLESLGLLLCVIEDPAARDRTLARRTPFDPSNRRVGNHCNSRKPPQEIEREPIAEIEPAPQPARGEPASRAHLRIIQLRREGARWGGPP